MGRTGRTLACSSPADPDGVAGGNMLSEHNGKSDGSESLRDKKHAHAVWRTAAPREWGSVFKHAQTCAATLLFSCIGSMP